MTITIDSPYNNDSSLPWLKGNLHTHTTRSDGTSSPQRMVDEYAQKEYDFLSLSDHDVLSDYTELDCKGMVLLDACEISGASHILHINSTKRVAHINDYQETIDGVNSDGGFAILCHPNWTSTYKHHPIEQMKDLNDYAGIEVVNGLCLTHAGNNVASDVWDMLLSSGKKIWGYATDDAHDISGVGLAWVMVRATDSSKEAILDALQNGSFYATNGVELNDIETSGSTIKITSDDVQTYRVMSTNGKCVKRVFGKTLEFDASELPDAYIRVEAYGYGDTMAWTQPFYIKGGVGEQATKLQLEKPVTVVETKPFEPKPVELVDINTLKKPNVNTQMSVCKSPDALSWTFQCEEPLMDKVKKTTTGNEDPSLWTNDCIEIFIKPTEKSCTYRATINSDGVYFTAGKENEKLAITTKKNDYKNGWSVSIDFPWSVFEEKVEEGDEWSVLFSRNRRVEGREELASTFPGDSFHLYQNYGILRFQ